MLAKELQLLHGDSFDFSCVTEQAAAAAAESASALMVPRSDVSGTMSVYTSGGQSLKQVQQLTVPQSLQKLLKNGGGKYRIRCVVCGRTLLVSADELLRSPMNCPDCETSSEAIKATVTKTACWRAQTCGTSFVNESSVDNSPSLISNVQQQQELEHVLKQLETVRW